MSLQQKIALWIGCFSTIVPAIFVCQLIPVLTSVPFGVWLGVSASGGLVAGLVATNRRRGLASICGAMACGGALLGIVAYVAVRSLVWDSDRFLKLEFVLGALLGATPGLLGYFFTVAQPNRMDPAS